jgi:hypothetical protein
MEEFFYLLPRAQASIKKSAPFFEKPTRFAEDLAHPRKLTCRLDVRQPNAFFRLFCPPDGTVAGSGSNSDSHSRSPITGLGVDACKVLPAALDSSSCLFLNSSPNVTTYTDYPAHNGFSYSQHVESDAAQGNRGVCLRTSTP